MNAPLVGLSAIARLAVQKLRPVPFSIIPQGQERGWIEGRPAHFVPDHLDRVTGFGFGSTMERELGVLRGRRLPNVPIARYRVGPALVAGGQVFAGGRRFHLSSRRLAAADVAAAEDIPGPVTLVSTAQGLKYFGHWLRDDCAAYEALRDEDARLLSLPRPGWPDARLYETAFEQDWQERAVFRTPDLTLARDIGFSPDKRSRIEALRDRLRRNRSAAHPAEVVYLERGPGGARREISNRDALVARLEREGARVVAAEGGDVVRSLLDARLVITVEGSQAAHAVYTLAPGGALLVLQPPQRFYNPHADWCQLLGMRYGIVVGEADGPETFRIRPDEVVAMARRLVDASA